MAENNRLPQGWNRVKLGDVIDIVRGISFPKDAKLREYQKGSIVCLRTANVQKEVDWEDLWFVSNKYVKRDEQYVQVSDILISTANSLKLVGKVALVRELPYPSTLGAFISLLRPSSHLNKKCMYFLLLSEEIQSAIRSRASTTTNISNISTKSLVDVTLKIPPLAEQKRIVAKIEELFTQLDAGVEELIKARAQLKRYRQSVLKAAVEGELTREWRKNHKDEIEPASKLLEHILTERRARWDKEELAKMRVKGKDPKDDKWKDSYKEPIPPEVDGLPKLPEGWVWANLQQISWNASYGTSQKCNYEIDGPPVIRIPNIINGNLDFTDIKFGTKPAELGDDKALTTNDLLIIRTNGSKDLIGRAALVKNDYKPPHFYASYLIRYRILDVAEVPDWGITIWDSPLIRIWLEGEAATTAGQYNVNVSKLDRLPIPIPSEIEQEIIIAEVERRLSVAGEIEKELERALTRAEYLRHSILKKAFEGKLVPQNLKDEPASVLLEHIKTEKASCEGNTY